VEGTACGLEEDVGEAAETIRSLVASFGVGDQLRRAALGDDCVVEAGLYVTAGTKVSLLPAKGSPQAPRIVKARDLSGADGILFRRNSLTGAIEAVPRAGTAGIELNSSLHAN